MQDKLNAIRWLYGEPGSEGAPVAGLPPEGQAEAEALAAVKAGLDALPPQRPDPATLEALFAAVVDDTLAPIRAVYENAPVPPQAEAEVAALAAMKAGLDALPRQRPDAATLAAVFAAAPGEATSPIAPGRAEDRLPRRNGARRRVVVALSTVFALALVFSTGLWLGQDDGPPALAVSQDAPTGAEEAESDPTTAPLAEAVPNQPTPDAADEPQTREAAPVSRPLAEPLARAEPPARRAAPPPAAPAETASAFAAGRADFERTAASAEVARTDEDTVPALVAVETLPLADGDDELRLLYLRMLEMQAAQAGLGWGEPPVALGTALDSVPPSTGWMQVRVER